MQCSKTNLLLFLLFFISGFVKAQDVQFANTQALPMAINPALTGFIPGTDNMRITSAARHQWSSFLGTNSAFNTIGLSFDMRNCFPRTNTMLKKTEGPTWGLGMSLLHDRSGTLSVGELEIPSETPLLRDFIDLYFSVILPSGKNSFFSAGFRGGAKLHRIDTDQFRFDEQFDGVSGFDRTSESEFQGEEQLNTNQVDLGLGLSWTHFGQKWGFTGGASIDRAFKKVRYDFIEEDTQPLLNRKLTINSKLAITAPKKIDDVRYGLIVRPLLLVYQQPYLQYLSGIDVFFQTLDNSVFSVGGGIRMSRHVEKVQHMDAGFVNISLGFRSCTVGLLYEVNASRLVEATKHYGTVEVSFVWHWKRSSDCSPLDMGCDEELTHALFF